jgi:hypothetical protein
MDTVVTIREVRRLMKAMHPFENPPRIKRHLAVSVNRLVRRTMKAAIAKLVIYPRPKSVPS